MKHMRNVLGFALVVGGVALGVYVGLWVCFIGGIVQIVDAVKATPTEGLDIAIGIAKIVFAGAAGAFSALVMIFPGAAMIKG